MSSMRLIVLSILLCGSWAKKYKFPEWFKFGAASAAYQVEGAWNVSDKGEGIWDRMLHASPETANGDVACDSYHLWRRDIEMAQELGLDMYRFSVSWPRLLPTGFSNKINEDGKRYYNNLIDGLLQKGIEPIITLYHYDLPQYLQDLGGWANPLIADWFADYADVLFFLYADRVKIWVTINEPLAACIGYEQPAAPYIDDPYVGEQLCYKHLLIAHAKAYRIYDEYYKPKYHGKVSMTNLFFWFEPETPEDTEATQLALEYWEGRFSHPIYSKEGGWPKKLEQILLENSKKEGYPYRLPPFTPEEVELVRGTYDYYGLNHYTTRLVRRVKSGDKQGTWPFEGAPEIKVNFVNGPSWKTTALDWFPIYPEGLRQQLHWLNRTYDLKEIIIIENGVVSLDSSLVDSVRVEYIRDNLEQVLLAIKDGIPVTGYTAWTMMDNFEWVGGYGPKYGLYAVDFNDPNRTRTPRESARFYASITKGRTLHTGVDVLNNFLK